jgi:hypothetical protein
MPLPRLGLRLGAGLPVFVPGFSTCTALFVAGSDFADPTAAPFIGNGPAVSCPGEDREADLDERVGRMNDSGDEASRARPLPLSLCPGWLGEMMFEFELRLAVCS